tara:strand:- start:22007 stop:22744 length:738 start_codon:yes stop_codon:yes gene_type:complete
MDNNAKQEEIARILENLPAEELHLAVDVPSRCKFYELEDPTAPITVRAMTFEDERAIADARRKGADAIAVMLNRCVSNIKPEQMLSIDRVAVLFKIREATYGPSYSLTMPCNNCKKVSDIKIDINKNLILNSLPDDFTDPRKLKLPSLGKEVVVRMAKAKDEEVLTGSDLYSHLWRFVLDIDGCSNKEIISEVLKKLPVKDLHLLVKEVTCSDYGLHPRMIFSCPHCGHEEEVAMPITTDFFLGT